MWMRRLAAVTAVVALAAGPAAADKLNGFSGVDRPYLVNEDRVCKPLAVANGAAKGAPSCEKAAADAVAKLSIKPPVVQTGPKATFAAAAAGKKLTVTRKQTGAPVVEWDAPDAIGKIVDVYASPYEDRVAVAYTTRQLGKEVTAVIAFDLGQAGAPVSSDPAANPAANPPPANPTTPAPPEDPKLTAAVAAARKAPKAKSLAAWQAVLVLDGTHSEALYQVAVAQLAAKQTAEAMAALQVLGASTRPDAIEWLVQARFDAAFAPLRGEPKFRAAVGLDRKATSVYEKLMGFGGQFEQSGTSCEKPEVRFVAARDHTFKLRVKSACQGMQQDMPFKGSWRIEGDRIVLGFPNAGKVTAKDEAGCSFESQGDEDALRCKIDRDLEFTVLPARR